MNPYLYKAKIVSIYDGDSITIHQDFGCGFWRHNVKCRLYGIDAPELRGEERPEGLIAKDALHHKLIDRWIIGGIQEDIYKEIIIETHKDKSGKYGRLLITIWLDGENINEWLLDNGYAEVYK